MKKIITSKMQEDLNLSKQQVDITEKSDRDFDLIDKKTKQTLRERLDKASPAQHKGKQL